MHAVDADALVRYHFPTERLPTHTQVTAEQHSHLNLQTVTACNQQRSACNFNPQPRFVLIIVEVQEHAACVCTSTMHDETAYAPRCC